MKVLKPFTLRIFFYQANFKLRGTESCVECGLKIILRACSGFNDVVDNNGTAKQGDSDLTEVVAAGLKEIECERLA